LARKQRFNLDRLRSFYGAIISSVNSSGCLRFFLAAQAEDGLDWVASRADLRSTT
jgi:hypothetical protein